MTDAEWIELDPHQLSFKLQEHSSRKLRLLAVALCRHFTWMMDCDGVPSAVEAIELFADTGKTKVALRRARQTIVVTRTTFQDESPEWQSLVRWALFLVQVAAAENAVTSALQTAVEIAMRKDGLSNLGAWRELRLPVSDVTGNPFQPVAFDPRWRSEHTVGIASKMYDDRDFAAMPILADALEEAGCDSESILNHCREPGVQVCGCWVVDLVLGKS